MQSQRRRKWTSFSAVAVAVAASDRARQSCVFARCSCPSSAARAYGDVTTRAGRGQLYLQPTLIYNVWGASQSHPDTHICSMTSLSCDALQHHTANSLRVTSSIEYIRSARRMHVPRGIVTYVLAIHDDVVYAHVNAAGRAGAYEVVSPTTRSATIPADAQVA